jgi:heme/copper-type cytochrome/quinol oxidase subunit 2
LAAGAALSVMVYFFQYNDFGMRGQINKSLLEMVVLTMPYLWLIFLSIFVFIIYYNLKHTKTGYRYPIGLVIIVAISASIFLGGLFALAGWGEKMDEMLATNTPFYGRAMNPHLDFWSNPEDGRLVGMINSTTSDGNLNIIDKDSQEWMIEIADAEIEMPIIINKPIRILGTKKSNNVFKAQAVFPMMPGRGFFKHMGPSSGLRNNEMRPPRMGNPKMKNIF